MSSGVILLQRPCISFSSPLLLILRQEITAAAVALFCFCDLCGPFLEYWTLEVKVRRLGVLSFAGS